MSPSLKEALSLRKSGCPGIIPIVATMPVPAEHSTLGRCGHARLFPSLREPHMNLHKQARPTLTVVELDIEDELHFVLADGQIRRILLRDTYAWVTHKTGGGNKPE